MSRSWLIVPLLILYLFHLGGVGFLGPDEPRYASIGREMARSHDFITPRLDGEPWFEKPPLLYWTIALGRAFRLPDEWAARLPVALASIFFLIFFFETIQREFSDRVAVAATTILATSAGWVAYSFAAVTDLLMTVTFAAAMLIAIFDTRRERGYWAGALLGLSILAKGLVPVVLFAPMFLIARGKRWTTFVACGAVAAPWYVLCGLRNGSAFWQDLLVKQHLQRYLTPALQHVQHFWYYGPVLLAGLFPWTPLAALLVRRKTYDDVRIRFLAVWLIFALAFFSLAQNKLPGYVLPLLPALAVMLAAGLDKTGSNFKWWIGESALMLIALPAIAAALPDGIFAGIRRAPLVLTPPLPFVAFAVAVAGIAWWLAWHEKTAVAVIAAGLAVGFGALYVKAKTIPSLDDRVSVRGFWRAHGPEANGACVDPSVRRELVYGLNYYAQHPLHECTSPAPVPRITIVNERLAVQSR